MRDAPGCDLPTRYRRCEDCAIEFQSIADAEAPGWPICLRLQAVGRTRKVSERLEAFYDALVRRARLLCGGGA